MAKKRYKLLEFSFENDFNPLFFGLGTLARPVTYLLSLPFENK